MEINDNVKKKSRSFVEMQETKSKFKKEMGPVLSKVAEILFFTFLNGLGLVLKRHDCILKKQ